MRREVCHECDNNSILLNSRHQAQLLGWLLGLALILPLSASAGCGDIVASSGERTPIADCTDPFMAASIDDPALVYAFGTTTIRAGTELFVSELPTTAEFSLNSAHGGAMSTAYLYRLDGNDWYEQAAIEVVPPPLAPVELTFAATGTYSLVLEEQEIQLMLDTRPRWQQLLLPTAYALTWSGTRHVITFTVTLAEPDPDQPEEPTGASSVLFLPGIQASRLYTLGGLFPERQLWTPLNNNDVRRLAMTTEGESVNDVYTDDIIDSVLFVGSIYGNIASYFDKLVTTEKIAAWQPYAYDWRYAVDDIVRSGTQYKTTRQYLIPIVEELASSSFSGQVSIVAHSNGGLLAKALVAELEVRELDHLIDAVILVASPQLGTPKAVGSLLHGYDQNVLGGFVISAHVAREVIRNMPSAYGLLPTQEYFNSNLYGPVIAFSEGVATQHFVDVYSDSIRTNGTLYDFLLGIDGRPPAETVYDAISANSKL